MTKIDFRVWNIGAVNLLAAARIILSVQRMIRECELHDDDEIY